MNATTEKIANGAGVNAATAERVLGSLRQQVLAAIASGDSLELLGFGKFYGEAKPERQARNPRTQEEVTVPAKLIPKFSFSGSFKNQVQPELADIEEMLQGKEAEDTAAPVLQTAPPPPPHFGSQTPPPPPPQRNYWVSRNGGNPVQMAKSYILPDDLVYTEDRGYVKGSLL
ncbi:MAG: HU family DNA-binding protein [Oscillatoria sp. SIO1A7]|nr:HU family DNA-binding protein [Oscillatoria sp. SIO1A7]